jgi:hypothetical protein
LGRRDGSQRLARPGPEEADGAVVRIGDEFHANVVMSTCRQRHDRGVLDLGVGLPSSITSSPSSHDRTAPLEIVCTVGPV